MAIDDDGGVILSPTNINEWMDKSPLITSKVTL